MIIRLLQNIQKLLKIYQILALVMPMETKLVIYLSRYYLWTKVKIEKLKILVVLTSFKFA
jgi:hypothetical protein